MRDLVYRRLASQAERFPNFDLAPLDTSRLSDRDAAFARAIHDGALGRWITLAAMLQPHLRRPFHSLDPRARAALIGGATQMVLLDKVPPHAAINESVNWIKSAAKPVLGGLVNAALRSLARALFGADGPPEKTYAPSWTNGPDQVPLADGRALILRAEAFTGPDLERAARATGHDPMMAARWAQAFGPERAMGLLHHGVCDPPITLHAAHARSPVPETAPHDVPGSLVYTGPAEGLRELLSSREDVWVQDAASSRAAVALRDALAQALPAKVAASGTGATIADICAGQGTKSRQLAWLMPSARVLATDVDARRMRALRAIAQRDADARQRGQGPAGQGRLEPFDPAAITSLAGVADAVLLDVPCSNSGVIPRRPEARCRFDARQLRRLTDLQREILGHGLALLGPGGVLVYSTCSLEREENEEQAAWAAANLGLVVVSEQRTFPSGLPGQAASAYHDGAYHAILRRA